MKKLYFSFLTMVFLIVAINQKTVVAQDLQTDSLAIVTLYNECGGANWTGFDTWLNGPIANWEAVTVSEVDGTPRVTHVEFSGMTLTGTLPEELGNLTEMSGKIQLHNQPGLTGEFPAFIWNWTKVERMQIKWCGFTSIDVTGIEKMVNLYELNTQETPFEGEIPAAIFNLPLMRDVYFESGKWTSLAADMPIPTPTPLRRFYINGNQFTDLPDLTGMVWAEGAKIKIRNNQLTFEDIVPNMWIASDANVSAFEYSPQATVGDDMYVYAAAGSTVTLESNIAEADGNIYSWFKGSVENDPVGESKDLEIASFDPATQSGDYFCIAQNSNVEGLNITTGLKKLWENSMAPDSLALVALYNECGGANWTGFDTWLNGPIANWEAVTVSEVDGTPRVTHVEFSGMTLTGTLPEELGNLTEMSGKIQLHNQPGLTGEFPAFIWNWTKVERMQIKWCGFTSIDVTGIEKMVNLYELNTQETPFEGEIPAAIFNLPLMRDVYFESGKWTSLAADMPIPTPTPLRRFYINGNQFTDLPDLTGMVWAEGAKIKIRNNQLTFEDIVPNMWIASDANVSAFEYSPQATVGDDMYVYAAAGSTVTLESNIAEADGNIYSWFKGSVENDPVGESKDLEIASFDPATQSGDYFCIAQNSNVEGLNITTGLKKLWENSMAPDSLALVALYNECGGANWTGFDTWLNGPIANWEAVTVSEVDGTPRVTHVEFSGMTLTGTLPEELGNLTEMSGKIQLHNQPGLTGEFPAFIWNWTKVERMQIKWCGFTSIDVTGIEKMVNLYELNTQETPFEGEIPAAIFNLPLMRDVYFESGKWTSLAADMPIPTPTPLRRFYINGNQFTDLPDLTGMVWAEGAKIKIRNNQLTFEDIVPNMWIASDANVSAFEYSPQATVGDDMYVYAAAGSTVTLESNIAEADGNIYSWFKGSVENDPVGESKDLEIASFDPAMQSGDYFCIAQNSNVEGLNITTGLKKLWENSMAPDSLALVALYNECGGANWTGFDTWLNGPIANWEAVTVSEVDGTPRVTHVEFSGMTLTGTLPEELGNLTEMSGKIQLHNQPGLTGEFPAFIWNWTKVERMQIKWCGFTSIDVTGIEKMVNLYELNTQETPFEGEIPAAIFNLPLMRDVYLEDCKWTSLPADMPIPTPTPLRRFYINGNQFTDLPDLTGMVWAEGAKIKIRNNQLTFEDIEPNMWISEDANVSAFEYSPQALLSDKETVTVATGEAISLSVTCGGSQNIYTWLKDGETIDGADSGTLEITSAVNDDEGLYQCVVQSTLVPGLDLASDTMSVVVDYLDGIEELVNEFRINGNPVKEVLSIDSSVRVEYVTITDITGKICRIENIHSRKVRMNVNDLINGIYFVRLKTNSSDKLIKVIKQ